MKTRKQKDEKIYTENVKNLAKKKHKMKKNEKLQGNKNRFQTSEMI